MSSQMPSPKFRLTVGQIIGIVFLSFILFIGLLIIAYGFLCLAMWPQTPHVAVITFFWGLVVLSVGFFPMRSILQKD